MRFIKLISIISLLTLCISTSGFAQDSHVQKSTEKVRIGGETYYIHSVKKGETIYSLTKVYGIPEGELMRTNPQLADGLKEGQVLRISEKPALQNTQQTATPKPDGAIEHEVQRKETLFSISRQYNVSVDAIKMLNPTISDNIQKGQVLYIPATKASNAAQRTPATAKPKQESGAMVGEHVYHSVKQGETLYSIVQQYNTDDNTIKALNPDAFKGNALMEGAILRIPKYEPKELGSGVKVLFPGYTYQSNETSAPVNTYRHNRDAKFNVA